MAGLRLQTHDLAAGVGEARNPWDHTELAEFARLIACGTSRKADIT
jgi:hypothetical protein